MVRNKDHLHESFSTLQEVLTALRFGTFLEPVDDSLIRNTVFVIQNLQNTVNIILDRSRDTHFENLRESFDDTGVFITIHLDNVN